MHRQELAQMRLKRFPIASFSMLFSVVPLFELLGILMKDEGSWLVLIVDNCAGCRADSFLFHIFEFLGTPSQVGNYVRHGVTVVALRRKSNINKHHEASTQKTHSMNKSKPQFQIPTRCLLNQYKDENLQFPSLSSDFTLCFRTTC